MGKGIIIGLCQMLIHHIYESVVSDSSFVCSCIFVCFRLKIRALQKLLLGHFGLCYSFLYFSIKFLFCMVPAWKIWDTLELNYREDQCIVFCCNFQWYFCVVGEWCCKRNDGRLAEKERVQKCRVVLVFGLMTTERRWFRITKMFCFSVTCIPCWYIFSCILCGIATKYQVER